MARHNWKPNPDAPHREDMRTCARAGCGMLRNDYGAARYEYRAPDWTFIANRRRRYPAPPCPGAPESKKEETR